jgi:arylsulfatase A-like enzyme
LLLAATAAAVLPVSTVADTVTFDDSADDTGAASIRTMLVDNTGDGVGVQVRHRGISWIGAVDLRIDVAGGPAAEYFAIIERGTGKAHSLRTANGSPWVCEGLLADSVTTGRLTQLTGPRSCFGGAAFMTVRARVLVKEVAVDSAASRVVNQQTRPNIVMIMLDDMRADDLRYMPLTQRLIGDQGVTFANSLAPYPLCCPARASVLTGQYAHNHRVWSHVAPWGFPSFDDRSTLATWLQDSGYATTYIGKYLNGYGNLPEPGQETGTSTTYVPPGWTDWRASIDGGLAPDHPDDGGTYRYTDTTLNDNGVAYAAYPGRYQSRVYGELSEEVVTTRAASDQPFFFYVSYTAPHGGGPRDPDDPEPVFSDTGTEQRFVTPHVPPEIRGTLDDVILEAPGADWFRETMPQNKPAYIRDLVPMNDSEKAALLEVTRQRAESLAVVDAQVARTIAALERTGELEETLVLLTSDNGYFLGEQGLRTGKVLPHDPSLRVPLVMRGPGIPAGEVRYDPFLSIDFAPTLAELAGVEPGLPQDGVSMLSVARNGDRGWIARGAHRDRQGLGRAQHRRGRPAAESRRTRVRPTSGTRSASAATATSTRTWPTGTRSCTTWRSTPTSTTT